MSKPGTDPVHPPVEGPESPLEDVREQAHAQAGQTELVEALEARLAAAEAKLAEREKELTERLARLQADFENFRRRAREDAAAATARGKGDLAKALLPALDSLDRALAHADDEGLRLLARQLQTVLAEGGVHAIDPSGEAFDAKLHEALASEAREGVKAGTILTVVEKGYTIEGRVLRPARVVVAA